MLVILERLFVVGISCFKWSVSASNVNFCGRIRFDRRFVNKTGLQTFSLQWTLPLLPTITQAGVGGGGGWGIPLSQYFLVVAADYLRNIWCAAITELQIVFVEKFVVTMVFWEMGLH